ncbi:cation diffusion facilitator family transporter [Rheinheimera marina]|uniref:Cation diffusion facilitator family transporter n=1 Tax=Rheinheimera marina TaxID=1774958 RepID=A0ABV9JMD3_9GAMM
MQADYQLWVKRSAYLTLCVAVLILVLKLWAVLLTDSSAMLASFTDAALDLLISVLNFAVLRYALRPADDNHSFGHGKAEAVMALLQAAFLAGAALLVLLQAISGAKGQVTPQAPGFGMVITLSCMALTLLLVLAQHWIIRRTGSLAVKSDSLHYRSDLLMNTAVLLALGMVWLGWLWADWLMAVLIALYLLWNAMQLARESLQHLLDEQLPPEELLQIKQLVLQHAHVLACLQLRTRRAGPKVFIQCVLVLDDHWTLKQAHQIVDEVELKLQALYVGAEVMIHPEPRSDAELLPE